MNETVEAAFERDLASHGVTDKSPETPLFHYTDEGGLRGILQSGEIWATHYTGTNDRLELCVGEDAIVDVAKELAATARDEQHRRLFGQLAKDYSSKESLTRKVGVFLACFTRNGDQLSQWRAYGGASASGYAIGFAEFPTPSAPDPAKAQAATMWLECTYDRDAFCEDLRNAFRAVIDACDRHRPTYGDDAVHASYNWLCRLAAMRQPMLKHSGFYEEREWRLVVMPYPNSIRAKGVDPAAINSRDSKYGRVEYLNVPLKLRDGRLGLSSINLGPGHGTEELVRAVLEQTGYDPGLIRRSDTPFR